MGRVKDYSILVDSGAHTFFNLVAKGEVTMSDLLTSDKFLDYLDEFIEFYHKYSNEKIAMVMLDVILDPKRTQLIYDYMRECGCVNIMPVVHVGTDFKYIEYYLNRGCSYIGMGGIGQAVKMSDFLRHTDNFFYRLTDDNNQPIIKVHGFACTSVHVISRYPWYSVDSTTWRKTPAYGSLIVPTWTGSQFDFTKPSTVYCGKAQSDPRHYAKIQKHERKYTDQFLEMCGFTAEEILDTEDKVNAIERSDVYILYYEFLIDQLNKHGSLFDRKKLRFKLF